MSHQSVMKSFYSLIRFVNNPLSKENITVGLIVLSGNDIHFKFSQKKLNLVSKINPNNHKLFEYTIDKIRSFLGRESNNNHLLFSNNIEANMDYLNRLSIYNNGFLQFDKPAGIDIQFDDSKFHNFFTKYVELEIQKKLTRPIDKTFKNTINRLFSIPLKSRIDINVKIKKEKVPGLFFDYKLDGIGLNGVIYSVKSIDLNSEPNLDEIQKKVAEFETLSYRLNSLSKDREDLFTGVCTKGINQHYLVIDPYSGEKDSYIKLHEILADTKYDLPYKVIASDDLQNVTEDIIQSGAKGIIEKL